MTRVVLAILMSLWIRGVSADSFEFAGIKRSYSLFVPSSSAAPAPLIVLLHGSYGNAAAIVSWWTSLAEQEGIVLVAPDARERAAWQLRAEVPAGAWRAPNEFRAVPYAKRKIPIAIFIGDKDEYFPLFAVRKTQSALEKAGHPVNVTVIPGHRHPYSDVALEVNRNAWQFMKASRL